MYIQINQYGLIISSRKGLVKEKCIRDLCLSAEKWFASGESNVFRLSGDYINGLS
jgi:hypothetical protein